MAQFICPSCGSEFFITAKVGPKTIFQVEEDRMVKIIQAASGCDGDADIDESNIFCGACSWHGIVGELIASDRD